MQLSDVKGKGGLTSFCDIDLGGLSS